MDLTEHKETMKKRDEDMLRDIVEKTNKIHASFLFWGPLTDLLKQLSINLCATPASPRYNGWVELGVKLGLEDNAVKSIEHTQIVKQDPVYVMLLAYSQKDDSTVANIYIALSQLNRKDVICKTYTAVLSFHKRISLQFTIPHEGIIKAPRMPEVPHIFKHFEADKQDTVLPTKPQTKTKTYKKVVFLTYVPGSTGIVEKVVKEFRKELDGQFIGVLMLEEHRKRVFNDPNIIRAFYKRAHYIIVILTVDYLTQLSGGNSFQMDNLDGRYATYIYSQMMSDYLIKGCKNKKVRCIIPDDEFEDVIKHYFFQPMFQAWIKECDITTMSKQILDGKI